MSTTGKQSGAGHDGGPGVATMVFVDLRVRSQLFGEARKRALTRSFGTPREHQSFLVTALLIGAAATVLRDLVPPLPRPSRTGVAIGGSVVNAAFRGIAGEPSAAMPLAGALIAFGLVSNSLRPTIVQSARQLRGMTRQVRAAFGARYAR